MSRTQKFPIASIIRSLGEDASDYFVHGFKDGEYRLLRLNDKGGLDDKHHVPLHSAEEVADWKLTDKKPKPSWFKYIYGDFTLAQVAEYAPMKWLTDKKVDYALVPGNAGLKAIMGPYVGNDELRPIMTNLYFDEHGVTATDAHVLIHIAGKVDEKHFGIYSLDGKPFDNAEDRRYPNYQAVFPKKNESIHKINPELLYNWCRFMRQSGVANGFTHQASFGYGDDARPIGFNVVFLATVARSMMKLGGNDWHVHLSEPNRAAIFVNHNHTIDSGDDTYALSMPVMLDGQIRTTSNGEEDRISVPAYFDFGKNAVVENDTVINFKALITGATSPKVLHNPSVSKETMAKAQLAVKKLRLRKKLSELKSALFEAQVKDNARFNAMGWGSGMRKSKLGNADTHEKKVKERIEKVEKQLAALDPLPKENKLKLAKAYAYAAQARIRILKLMQSSHFEYAEIFSLQKALLKNLDAYALKRNEVDAHYHTAKQFLKRLAEKSFKDIKTRNDYGKWLKNGRTIDLMEALENIGYDSKDLSQFNAFALLDSVSLTN